MVLIAFANARSEIKAHRAINKSGGTDLPSTYASYGKIVAMLFDKYPPTQQGDLEIPTAAEIKFRRIYHFFRAAVLGGVSERAHEDNEHLQAVADIWGSYIESARHLAVLIEHTKIWSEDEIEWFTGESSGDGQIRNVLYTVVPDFLWHHDEMLKMAKQKFGVSSFSLRPRS